MTIYELLSLQKPFDNLYKINPSVDIDKYISKEKRPSLSVKVRHILDQKICHNRILNQLFKYQNCFYHNKYVLVQLKIFNLSGDLKIKAICGGCFIS